MIHDPKLHLHKSTTFNVKKKVQIYRCLADGCEFREERPLVQQPSPGNPKSIRNKK
jgi:hypothetical protein